MVTEYIEVRTGIITKYVSKTHHMFDTILLYQEHGNTSIFLCRLFAHLWNHDRTIGPNDSLRGVAIV